MARRVVFLDRDGTINVDHGYVHRIADWQFTDRAVEALQRLQQLGYKLAVVTNQSGIARQYYCLEEVHNLHSHMQDLLARAGVQLDAIALCPHGDLEKCDCRKPATGMARQIEEQLGEIDYADSWTIGDKLSDLMFGVNLGTRTALIRCRYWQESDLIVTPTLIVDSLYEAAMKIKDLEASH